VPSIDMVVAEADEQVYNYSTCIELYLRKIAQAV
jgi:hypothetical protein